LDRAKTVRQFGQTLAQEKKMIVEIEEVVDLSSLEGGQPDNRGSRAFETMSVRQSIMPQETKSYYFPEDPDIPNWKPFSMSSVYILLLMALAITLAGVQEYLCQKSIQRAKENSGLIAFNKVSEISTWDFFAWKCKRPTSNHSDHFTDRIRPPDHGVHRLRRLVFHHGFRHSTAGTILPIVATWRFSGIGQPELRPPHYVSIFCAVQSFPTEAVRRSVLHDGKHHRINGRTILTKSLPQHEYQPKLFVRIGRKALLGASRSCVVATTVG
jgi:hypothetical protein